MSSTLCTTSPLRRLVGAFALLLLCAACEVADGTAGEASEGPEQGPVHVDSVFPIEEEIRRFQASLAEAPRRLEGGAPSLGELIERFVAALERQDRAELVALGLTRDEFGFLYYPTSRHARPPYELSPALVWFQMETRGARGLLRALQRQGGRSLGVVGHTCHPDPTVEGENRVWTGCRLDRGEGEPLVLFGPVLEREGRFKFLSYANPL